MATQSVNRDYTTSRLVISKANPRQGLEAYSTTGSVPAFRRISPCISSALAAPYLPASFNLWVDSQCVFFSGQYRIQYGYSLRWRINHFKAKVSPNYRGRKAGKYSYGSAADRA